MALYPLFRLVMKSIRTSMHASRVASDKKLRQPENIDKTSYHYALKDGHECNIYRRNDIETYDSPLVIDIHGGCWIYGDKDSYDAFSYDLVQNGMNVSSLTYCTNGPMLLKEQIQDVFEYLHFLHDNASRIGISLDQIMLTGDSAGAQLSLLFYAVNQSPELQKIFQVQHVDIDVKCLCLTHPVCFIDTAAELLDNRFLSKRVGSPGLKRMLYGSGYERRPEYLCSVTPDRYILDTMKFPEIMIVTSRGDLNFLSQSERLKAFFDSRKIPYTYYFEDNPEAGHVYNVQYPFSEEAHECNRQIRDFFKRVLTKFQMKSIPAV